MIKRDRDPMKIKLTQWYKLSECNKRKYRSISIWKKASNAIAFSILHTIIPKKSSANRRPEISHATYQQHQTNTYAFCIVNTEWDTYESTLIPLDVRLLSLIIVIIKFTICCYIVVAVVVANSNSTPCNSLQIIALDCISVFVIRASNSI